MIIRSMRALGGGRQYPRSRKAILNYLLANHNVYQLNKEAFRRALSALTAGGYIEKVKASYIFSEIFQDMIEEYYRLSGILANRKKLEEAKKLLNKGISFNSIQKMRPNAKLTPKDLGYL